MPNPLLSFNDRWQPRTVQNQSMDDSGDEADEQQKSWMHYLPLCCTFYSASFSSLAHACHVPVELSVVIGLMVAPQPSILVVLVNHYLRTLHSPSTFLIHLCISYTFTFLSFTSFIVCIARDPGPVNLDKPTTFVDSGRGRERDELGLREALMGPPDVDDDDLFSPVKWCRKCWAPKPERTHHCTLCGRCVLKMGERHRLAFVSTRRDCDSNRSPLPMARV